MSEEHYHLLYVLEKIKAACRNEHGVFHTWESSDDHLACLQLEKDGLIRRCNIDDADHFMWQL